MHENSNKSPDKSARAIYLLLNNFHYFRDKFLTTLTKRSISSYVL
jgi:hypothetical protein